ncbi:RnfABCDGE type electron transport complex subunit G [Clostridium sp. DL1XJH146]
MEKQDSILRLGLILFIVTAVAGTVLGGVHKITAEPIAIQAIKTNNEAMQEVLPSAEEFSLLDIEIPEDSMIQEVNEGQAAGEIAGYSIKVITAGYGGDVTLIVGISAEGTIQGMKILEHSETPGLGANAEKDEFRVQYNDKSVEEELTVVKTEPVNDNEIQALTGATITSKAVTTGVNAAIEFYNSELKGGK